RYSAHFRVDVREAAEIARLMELGQEDQGRRSAVRAEERAEFAERSFQALPARPAVAVERPVVVAVVAQPGLRALAEAGREQADERRAPDQGVSRQGGIGLGVVDEETDDHPARTERLGLAAVARELHRGVRVADPEVEHRRRRALPPQQLLELARPGVGLSGPPA